MEKAAVQGKSSSAKLSRKTEQLTHAFSSDNEQLRSTTERFRQLNQQGTQAQLRRGAISWPRRE